MSKKLLIILTTLFFSMQLICMSPENKIIAIKKIRLNENEKPALQYIQEEILGIEEKKESTQIPLFANNKINPSSNVKPDERITIFRKLLSKDPELLDNIITLIELFKKKSQK